MNGVRVVDSAGQSGGLSHSGAHASRLTRDADGMADGRGVTVLAGARGQKRVANYDEIGHRTGPRKKRTLYIADAKQATGHLITEIQIGQRMLGIIESSARYAQAMEAAARQRQQSYDDG